MSKIKKSVKREVLTTALELLLMMSCFLAVPLFPVILYFDAMAKKELKEYWNLKEKIFSLNYRNYNLEEVCRQYNYRQSLMLTSPDKESKEKYLKAKSEILFNKNDLRILEKRAAAHLEGSNKYKTLIEKITLKYYIRKLIAYANNCNISIKSSVVDINRIINN
jgi:hypothetical protein